jgi:hypothetical protein
VLLAAYIATIFGLARKASKGEALPPEPRLGARPGLQPAE